VISTVILKLWSTHEPSSQLDEILERSTTTRFEVVDGRSNPEQECSMKEARVLLLSGA
jgi:hypothetical protein